MCDQWCRSCGNTVKIMEFGKQICPICKEPIEPCSVCADDDVRCGNKECDRNRN